jgi:hypothetical protein
MTPVPAAAAKLRVVEERSRPKATATSAPAARMGGLRFFLNSGRMFAVRLQFQAEGAAGIDDD